MEAVMENKVGEPTELAVKIIARLKRMKMNKAEMAMQIGCSRPLVSQYLSGKYKSNPETIEKALIGFLESTEEEYGSGASADPKEGEPTSAPKKQELKKIPYFESNDYLGIMSVCQACQDNVGLGIIVGRSGYGKTHALKKYAKMPKVVYVECNEAMNCKDLVRKIERGVGLPKMYGSIDEHIESIIEFFDVNRGYLLLVDEADKLITKYTQKKIEILRYISDGSNVGIVIAGEPALESAVRVYDARFANRMDFYYKLRGLTTKEVQAYFSEYELDEKVLQELIMRATNNQNGCFRLLDRTLNNIMRVMKETGKEKVTLGVIQQASAMMMM